MHADRLEPAIARQRERAVEDRQQQITASQEIYRRLLSEVSWAIQSIRQLGELGGGLAPPAQPPISSEQEARLREFVEKITTGGHSPHDLDLVSLQDATPPDQADVSQPRQVGTEAEVVSGDPDAMDVDVAADSHQREETGDLTTAGTEAANAQHSNLNPADTDAQRSPRPSSAEPQSITQSQPVLNAPPDPPPKSRTESQNILLASAKTQLSRQSPPATNRHGTILPTNKPTIARAASLPSESSTQSLKASRFVSLDYASQLPPVPVQILASRLSAAQAVTGTASKNTRRQAIRSGLWIGPGSSEITKLGIKAQHIGVKSTLRKSSTTRSRSPHEKPKFNNVLTTADWKTMVDELQMTRALEMLERLKSEKVWAYSQIKKPRIAPVQKAHWDHLLDEMSWLQVDFRQERRWKIATAHRLAKQVLQWHQADSIGKQLLQVKVHSPGKQPAEIDNLRDKASSSLAPPHQIGPTNTRSIHLTRLSSEVGSRELASPSLSTKASPESFRTTQPPRSPIPTDAAPIPAVEKLTATTTSEINLTSPQESRKALQQIKRSRIPIFEMTPDETLIDVKKIVLDGIHAKPTGHTVEHVKLQKLFADLPLFGDLDSRPDKRPDEASPHLGRIARVAPFLEGKPLLVSTLQPSKNCLGKQWRNLGPLAADDLRESGDHKSDPSHHHSYIFSGRKSKDVKEPIIPAPPLSTASNYGRSSELTWASSDEELLKQIATTYEYNWRIIADVLNASRSQSACIPVTSRDCYDCWTRLQSHKPATHGPSTPLFKSNSESNPPAGVVPAPTLSNNAQLPSTETNEQNLTDDPLCANPSKRPGQASLFPNKRTAREDALRDISRKLKEQRSPDLPKPVSPGHPRQVNLNAHETHAQPIRPYMTPLEMSALKAERDRQAQAALEMAKRQQQMHQESLLHQARAAAVVAAAAQILPRTTASKVATSVNGSVPSRVHSQPTALNFNQGRHNGLPGVTIHRQVPQVPARYATSPPLINVSNRGTASPVPHPPAASHQARQSLMENQGPSAAPTSSQAPILPQLPNMPPGFQPKTPNSQSPAPGSTSGHHTPNGTTPTPNGLLNNTISLSLTPIQVAQYLQLQQQQHLQQQRSPEHRIHHQQHQQILLAQHFQQQAQHAHQASTQIFGHQSPTLLHQNAPIPNGQSQLSSGAASAANSTPPLAASSSPLPHPPV
ncbi:hypothetical protein PtA15_4A310 [Puccinia triticina]|uniref:HSA domain-containing protein n=1 Tax=Puccinia triticina TaxID=208348 RepID=A0ABY7CIA5_9BASI|nr:uncharacterized protein PtA15_4A310 [Puccinia triticina]WAQ83861.1 hypothetical protein PtA15_4A310 [Puccinia triticina]WAR54706.1 hypothetical protein PtB15_4B323 [Puccinia triticina]